MIWTKVNVVKVSMRDEYGEILQDTFRDVGEAVIHLNKVEGIEPLCRLHGHDLSRIFFRSGKTLDVKGSPDELTQNWKKRNDVWREMPGPMSCQIEVSNLF